MSGEKDIIPTMSGGKDMIPATEVVVVMVPFVAHGHLTQLLHLSYLVSGYDIPVHFVTTTNHIRQVRSRYQSSANPLNQIQFHEFSIPKFVSPPSNPSIPFPTHLQPSFDATLHLRKPVADLIRSFSKEVKGLKRIVVIHDVLMSFVVQDVKSIPNAETYVFQPPPAFYRSCSHWEKTGGPFPLDSELMNHLPSADGISSPDFLKFLKLQRSHVNSHVGELYDSSRVIEGEFIEYLQKEEISGTKKIWAMGPFNRIQLSVTVSKNRHRCLQWLDKQPQNSVVYVSFGTTTTFSDDQIKELALGLERSEQRFVWVVRSADTDTDIDTNNVYGLEDRMVKLPDGFEERVNGRGLIERGWAPQMEILGHFATGGFMSHCGWNSSMESIMMGVPMVTWPMHSDQPRNAFFITNVVRIGMAVKVWEHRNEPVTAGIVERVVKALMDSRDGEEIRRRAVNLGREVKRSVAEGGISRMEMDSFVSYIRR